MHLDTDLIPFIELEGRGQERPDGGKNWITV